MVQSGKYPRDPKIGEWAYSYSGILLSNEMNQLLSGDSMTKSQKHYVEQKKPDTKQTYYIILFL